MRKADKAGVIAIAKELGITLTDEDFAKPEEEGEISLKEADSAAGGKKCYCAVGGGGEPGDNDETCWCAAVGTGDGFPRWHGCNDQTEIERCICVGGGAYIFLIIFQINILLRFKKKTREFCEMSVQPK